MEFFEDIIPITEKSNRAMGIYPKILGYFLTVLIGGERFTHINYLGNREITAKMFEVKQLPANSSPIIKMFQKLTRWKTVELIEEKVWDFLFHILFKESKIEDWLDFDSTILERYGNQEGSMIGYNPKKKGRPSHHPLIAFLNKSQYVVNLVNRPGNSSSANNIEALYSQTLVRLKNRVRVLGIKADSGFYRRKFLQILERNEHQYIIAVPFYSPIQQILQSLKDWTELKDGLEFSEFKFKHESWDKERRYVAVRQKITRRPNASGKQLRLFPEFDEYRHSVLVTNIEDIHPIDVWESYKPRAGIECIITALKDDFALCGFSMKNFFATELAIILRIFLYNLFVYFKKTFLNDKEKSFTLRRLKPKYFFIPAMLGSAGNTSILRLSIPNQSIRAKFQSIIAQLNQHPPPLVV